MFILKCTEEFFLKSEMKKVKRNFYFFVLKITALILDGGLWVGFSALLFLIFYTFSTVSIYYSIIRKKKNLTCIQLYSLLTQQYNYQGSNPLQLICCLANSNRVRHGWASEVIRMAKCLPCSPETIVTFFINWLYPNTK